jgi:hypothetical protein
MYWLLTFSLAINVLIYCYIVGKKYSKSDNTIDMMKMNNRLETMIKMNGELEAMMHKMNVDNYMKFDQLITKNIELERQLSENNQSITKHEAEITANKATIYANKGTVLDEPTVQYVYIVKLTTPVTIELRTYKYVVQPSIQNVAFPGETIYTIKCTDAYSITARIKDRCKSRLFFYGSNNLFMHNNGGSYDVKRLIDEIKRFI